MHLHSREIQFWGFFFFSSFSLSLLCFAPPKPLNATQAYGPNLRYIVRWRRRDPRGSWYNETVRSARHVVWNTPIYVPYEIKVQAENDFGRAPEPDTYIGYSGEDCEYSSAAGGISGMIPCQGNWVAPVSRMWAGHCGIWDKSPVSGWTRLGGPGQWKASLARPAGIMDNSD